jgi:VanZ family protein
LIATAYGAIDEFHQSFVPGRSSTVADGIADAAGAALGAWIVGQEIVGRLRTATRRRP